MINILIFVASIIKFFTFAVLLVSVLCWIAVVILASRVLKEAELEEESEISNITNTNTDDQRKEPEAV